MNDKIEAAKEVRMWITQIIVPGIIVGAVVFTNPSVKNKIYSIKSKLKKAFKK